MSLGVGSSDQGGVAERARRVFSLLSNPIRSGFIGEALVFTYLGSSPVVRAIEFAPVDGAVYLNWPVDSSPGLYAERLAQALQDPDPRCCINFDVKTRRLLESSEHANGAVTLRWAENGPSKYQRQHCAFIIVAFTAAVGAARDWVAVVPTRLFDGLVCHTQSTHTNVFLWTAVDPALQPYAMPIEMLPAAIGLVVEVARTSRSFVNPWSGVDTRWLPERSPSRVVCAGPQSSNQSFQTSLRHIQWVKDAVQLSGAPVRFELNDVQPLLGDFILVFTPAGHRERWCLFEHKANQFKEDGDSVTFTLRFHETGFTRNPFHPLRVWDFILWHNQDDNLAYCIPRSRVPQRFCLERSPRLVVSLDELRHWRLELDDHGNWLQVMLDSIVALHVDEPVVGLELLRQTLEPGDLPTTGSFDDSGTSLDNGERRSTGIYGYGLHGGEGLVMPLWRHNPAGVYVFMPWAWTVEEQEAYWHSATLPADLLDKRLRPQTTLCIPIVTGGFFSASEQGGTLKAPQMQHGCGHAEEEAKHYFLQRESRFILVGDPCPAPLGSGRGNMPHPYMMIASEHLARPTGDPNLRALHSVRHWLPDGSDPFRYVLPLGHIYDNFRRMFDTETGLIRLSRHQRSVRAVDYIFSLSGILQAHADTADEDARMAASMDARTKYRYPIGGALQAALEPA